MKFQNIPFFRVQRSNQDWWVKIQTQVPKCTYYFGPFESRKEARLTQTGYIEDLVREGAQDIAVEIEKSRPQQLTIAENL